jgi:acyl carrier protein
VTEDEILHGLKELLADALRDTGGTREIHDDDDIVHGLGLDSLQMIHFLLGVETRFEIALDFEKIDLDTLGSVRQFADLVRALIPPKRA